MHSGKDKKQKERCNAATGMILAIRKRRYNISNNDHNNTTNTKVCRLIDAT